MVKRNKNKSNDNYSVDDSEIRSLNEKLKGYKKKYLDNWTISCIYIVLMLIGSALIAGWITFGFDHTISEKGPSAIGILTFLFTVFFTFLHPWKTYISAQSTYKALLKIKNQYADGRGNFEKINNPKEAIKTLKTLVEVAEEIYDKNIMEEDEKGFDNVLSKISTLNKSKQ